MFNNASEADFKVSLCTRCYIYSCVGGKDNHIHGKISGEPSCLETNIR